MKSSDFFLNKVFIDEDSSGFRNVAPREFHRSLPFYEKTPVHQLPELAKKLGIQNVLVKDESKRFGLRSFKPLGASFALHELGSEIRKERKEIVTATAGNHGVGVAFFGRYFEIPTTIYIPEYVTQEREHFLKDMGATVVRTAYGYDETVAEVKLCNPSRYQIVADTAWDGYEKIPELIREGYYTLFHELIEELERLECTDVAVLLQGGVGTFAASGIRYLLNNSSALDQLQIGIVEPEHAACLFESAVRKRYRTVEVGVTKAGCLACGEPNPIEWQYIVNNTHYFMKASDDHAQLGIDELKKYKISTSHTGAITLGASITGIEYLKNLLNISSTTTLVCINTEG